MGLCTNLASIDIDALTGKEKQIKTTRFQRVLNLEILMPAGEGSSISKNV